MLEFFLDAGLLQNDVRPMPRLDIAIHGEVAIGDRAMPDLVIALAHSYERAAVIPQDADNFGRIARHVTQQQAGWKPASGSPRRYARESPTRRTRRC